MTYDNFFNAYFNKSKISAKKHNTLSFKSNVMFSYSTAIGELVKDIEGRDVVLSSDENFSRTTLRHIYKLRVAANERGLTYYRLPQTYGAENFNPKTALEHLKSALALFKDSNLKQMKNRDAFKHNYEMLTRLPQLECFKEKEREIKELLKQYKDTFEFVNNYKRGK